MKGTYLKEKKEEKLMVIVIGIQIKITFMMQVYQE